ncbi:MAG: tetratricopeptide repeat protein [bacterium]|nr:MAG: tetratricopeptide repeat protein [bacterium]
MKRIITILNAIFIVQNLAIQIAVVHSYSLDSTSHTLMLQGLHQVHIEQYMGAIGTFENLVKLNPQHPIGYFCTAAVYKTIMQNYRIKSFESQLDSILNLTIEIGNKAIQNDREDALAYFYLGGAYGFRGLHKVRKRDWWGAFNDGLKGLSNLKKAVRIDSSLYDAYYGLGTFHYWRSAKSKILRFLLFRKDQQKGIDEIWTAIYKGRYTDIEGKYALVAIYYDHGDYEKAFSLNQQLYELFPTNPSCLYMRSKLYEQQEKWGEAKQIFQQLLKHLLNSEYRSIGYEVECLYGIAYCHYKSSELEQALKHVKKALDLRNERDVSNEIEGPLEDFNEIEKKAMNLYGTLINEIVGKE